ncbi:unnamed protein product [Calicophoron daubneyi]|uniref:Protein kinase domain-containing protein n=1 Tax=Calicophoron daubneyi TaxID=300641 RepID=A0AAV2T6A9_CALDB
MPLMAPRALNGLYFFCEPLAEGSFGVLYVAIHAITRQKVAIKILDKRKLGAEVFRVRSEIEALKQLNHKYIYKLYQVIETDYYFYLVVEYLSGGELFDYIIEKGHLTEVEARVIFRQIVSAIGYIHSKGFAHRDLKPENILLDSDQNVRIIDFGLCAKNSVNTMLNTFCGSFAYAAPEVLANKEYSGSAADLWSLGVILYTLLCGCLPFDPTKPEELSQRIGKGVFTVPDSLSKSSRHLLSQLMCVDPRKRIKIDELRKHPWIVEGFMGHPVDLNEEKIAMNPLNMRLVGEISDYTRIPKVELARMLQKRPYDYLMATYMIMEAALEEEDVFIHLQRRKRVEESAPRSHHHRFVDRHKNSGTVYENGDVTHHPADCGLDTDASKTRSRAPTLRSSTNLSAASAEFCPSLYPLESGRPKFAKSPVSAGNLSHRPQQNTASPQFNGFHDNENCQPSSNSFGESDRNTFKTPSTNGWSPSLGSHPLEPPTLSPSRSIDSQLAHLTQGIQDAQLSNRPMGPRPKCPNPNSDSSMPPTLSGAYVTSLSSASSTASSNIAHDTASVRSNPVTSDLSRSRCSADEKTNGSTGLGTGNGWKHFGRFRDVLTPKKPGFAPDGRIVSERLRKTRHLNNVILVRQDLAPGQVFDQIASALRQQSIRFTLKGSGFLCIFANDWGKTVLSFELELVYVSTRVVEAAAAASIKRRLTLKPRPTIAATKNSHSAATSRSPGRPTLTATKNPTAQVSSEGLNSQSREPSSGSSHHDAQRGSLDLNRQLGIKMKRIRGDSFMYSSLCRTILDAAGVKAAV